MKRSIRNYVPSMRDRKRDYTILSNRTLDRVTGSRIRIEDRMLADDEAIAARRRAWLDRQADRWLRRNP